MLLTSPHGRVVDIDDPDAIDRLRQQGFIDSTPAESEDYYARIRQMIATQEKTKPAERYFYQSVSPGEDGYGMSREILKRELFIQGINLDESFDGQKVGLLYSYPNGVLHMRSDVRIVYTMFESDKLPDEWKEYLAEADEILVPSQWCADTFKKAGFDTTVVPLGYNDRVFTYLERDLPVETGEPFTFLHYDSFISRKGFWEVFEAFNNEFEGDDSVKLVLKTTRNQSPVPIVKGEYPNIEVVTGKLSEKELMGLLARCHCMVYPSRGEGFGITPLEAMATGMPAIVPDAHGISQYFDKDYMLEAKVAAKIPAEYARSWGDVGKMVVCDVPDLQKQMRYAFEHQAEMNQLGAKASGYVKDYTYAQTATLLKKVLTKWQDATVTKRADAKILPVERV